MEDLETTLPSQAIATIDLALEQLSTEPDLSDRLGSAPATALEKHLNAVLRESYGLNASLTVRHFPGDVVLELELDEGGLKEGFTLSLPTTLRDVVLVNPV